MKSYCFQNLEALGLTRRELFKMGLVAGAGGLTAISGGRNFLPNLAEASGSSSSSLSMISPPCVPWLDPLPIPKTPVAVNIPSKGGPTPEEGQCLEKYNRWNSGINVWNPPTATEPGKWGANEDFREARTELHQRWTELGGLAACTQYELMAKEIDWNFYSDKDGRGLTSKVWTYVDVNFRELNGRVRVIGKKHKAPCGFMITASILLPKIFIKAWLLFILCSAMILISIRVMKPQA